MLKNIPKKTWILTGAFFVVIVLATWLLRIDIPYSVPQEPKLTAGYITLGDVFIYGAAMMLGGPLSALVSAFGGLIADLFAGHAGYALASFVIKGVAAYLAFFLLRRAKTLMQRIQALVISGVWMILAYFLFDFVIRGNYFVAAIAMPLRILQLIACAGLASLVLFLTRWKPYQKEDEAASPFASETQTRNLS